MTSISTTKGTIDVESGSELDNSVDNKGKAKEEPHIPAYEDATAGISDLQVSRLPPYRTRSSRYSPYGRPTTVPSSDIYDGLHLADRFFNTIYDDECVFLEVPPAVARRASTPHPLYDTVQEGPSASLFIFLLLNWNQHHQDFELIFQQVIHGQPTASTSGADVIAQINREHEVDAQDLAYALEDLEAYNIHVQNLAAAILTEFAAGLTRARVE